MPFKKEGEVLLEGIDAADYYRIFYGTPDFKKRNAESRGDVIIDISGWIPVVAENSESSAATVGAIRGSPDPLERRHSEMTSNKLEPPAPAHSLRRTGSEGGATMGKTNTAAMPKSAPPSPGPETVDSRESGLKHERLCKFMTPVKAPDIIKKVIGLKDMECHERQYHQWKGSVLHIAHSVKVYGSAIAEGVRTECSYEIRTDAAKNAAIVHWAVECQFLGKVFGLTNIIEKEMQNQAVLSQVELFAQVKIVAEEFVCKRDGLDCKRQELPSTAPEEVDDAPPAPVETGPSIIDVQLKRQYLAVVLPVVVTTLLTVPDVYLQAYLPIFAGMPLGERSLVVMAVVAMCSIIASDYRDCCSDLKTAHRLGRRVSTRRRSSAQPGRPGNKDEATDDRCKQDFVLVNFNSSDYWGSEDTISTDEDRYDEDSTADSASIAGSTAEGRENLRKSLSAQLALTRSLTITIPDFETAVDRGGSGKYVVYKVVTHRAGFTRILWKRYSQFHRLCVGLQAKYKLKPAPFPPKQLFGAMDYTFLQARRVALHNYIGYLLSEPKICNAPEFIDFFELTELPAK